jgi:hypothetical protein
MPSPCRALELTGLSRTALTLAPGYQSLPTTPFSRETPSPAAATITAADEHLASLVSVAISARLALLPTPIEPARLRVALVVPPARRSTSSSGRRRAAADELGPPLDPRASQPSQNLH